MKHICKSCGKFREDKHISTLSAIYTISEGADIQYNFNYCNDMSACTSDALENINSVIYDGKTKGVLKLKITP